MSNETKDTRRSSVGDARNDDGSFPFSPPSSSRPVPESVQGCVLIDGKERWCELRRCFLFWVKKEKDVENVTTSPAGVYDLSETVVKSVVLRNSEEVNKSKKRFSIFKKHEGSGVNLEWSYFSAQSPQSGAGGRRSTVIGPGTGPKGQKSFLFAVKGEGTRDLWVRVLQRQLDNMRSPEAEQKLKQALSQVNQHTQEMLQSERLRMVADHEKKIATARDTAEKDMQTALDKLRAEHAEVIAGRDAELKVERKEWEDAMTSLNVQLTEKMQVLKKQKKLLSRTVVALRERDEATTTKLAETQTQVDELAKEKHQLSQDLASALAQVQARESTIKELRDNTISLQESALRQQETVTREREDLRQRNQAAIEAQQKAEDLQSELSAQLKETQTALEDAKSSLFSTQVRKIFDSFAQYQQRIDATDLAVIEEDERKRKAILAQGSGGGGGGGLPTGGGNPFDEQQNALLISTERLTGIEEEVSAVLAEVKKTPGAEDGGEASCADKQNQPATDGSGQETTPEEEQQALLGSVHRDVLQCILREASLRSRLNHSQRVIVKLTRDKLKMFEQQFDSSGGTGHGPSSGGAAAHRMGAGARGGGGGRPRGVRGGGQPASASVHKSAPKEASAGQSRPPVAKPATGSNEKPKKKGLFNKLFGSKSGGGKSAGDDSSGDGTKTGTPSSGPQKPGGDDNQNGSKSTAGSDGGGADRESAGSEQKTGKTSGAAGYRAGRSKSGKRRQVSIGVKQPPSTGSGDSGPSGGDGSADNSAPSNGDDGFAFSLAGKTDEAPSNASGQTPAEDEGGFSFSLGAARRK